MAQTIVEKFFERVATHPQKIALRYKRSGSWRVGGPCGSGRGPIPWATPERSPC